MGNFLFFIYELINNILNLTRVIVYYVVESLLFGLIINLIWKYLFSVFFNLEISYLNFVGFLIIYRLLFFNILKYNNNQDNVKYEE